VYSGGQIQKKDAISLGKTVLVTIIEEVVFVYFKPCGSKGRLLAILHEEIKHGIS